MAEEQEVTPRRCKCRWVQVHCPECALVNTLYPACVQCGHRLMVVDYPGGVMVSGAGDAQGFMADRDWRLGLLEGLATRVEGFLAWVESLSDYGDLRVKDLQYAVEQLALSLGAANAYPRAPTEKGIVWAARVLLNCQPAVEMAADILEQFRKSVQGKEGTDEATNSNRFGGPLDRMYDSVPGTPEAAAPRPVIITPTGHDPTVGSGEPA